MNKQAVMETYGTVMPQPYGRYDLWATDDTRNNTYGSIDAMYEHIDVLMWKLVKRIEDER
jgi:hypothetical protein